MPAATLKPQLQELETVARTLRRHILQMIAAANSGHPGGSLSAVEIVTALYFGGVLKHDPKRPDWPDRDRFILSKGHGVPVLYAALAEQGYFPVSELKTLRQVDSRMQGHPVQGLTPGIEASTGSLGQGLSIGIGHAIAGRLDSKPYSHVRADGRRRVPGRPGVGSGAHRRQHELATLTAIVDPNRFQLDGEVENINRSRRSPRSSSRSDGRDRDRRPRSVGGARGAARRAGAPRGAHLHHRAHREGEGRELHGEQQRVPRQGAHAHSRD